MFLARVPMPEVPLSCVHQHLFGYFTVPAGAPRPFIYRVEDQGRTVCMLSRLPPATPYRVLNTALTAGRAYAFEALLSPVNGKNLHGKHETRVFRTNDERRAWLQRALWPTAELRFVQFFDRPALVFQHRGHRVSVPTCLARGTLYVADLSRFREFLLVGPGKGKCWGRGLVYLPEVMA